jgi:hypothetical protein
VRAGKGSERRVSLTGGPQYSNLATYKYNPKAQGNQ